jgi:hypothetical protein
VAGKKEVFEEPSPHFHATWIIVSPGDGKTTPLTETSPQELYTGLKTESVAELAGQQQRNAMNQHA